MSTTPNVKFAKTHEWIRAGEEVAAVGISDHAQESLGDITFVELPQVGTVLQKGDTFGVVESVKAASDLYAPVSGEVVEVNHELDSAPEKVNQSPYGDGWIIKIRVGNTADLESLLSPEDYERSL
jgi:glycine cleavage system H protein